MSMEIALDEERVREIAREEIKDAQEAKSKKLAQAIKRIGAMVTNPRPEDLLFPPRND